MNRTAVIAATWMAALALLTVGCGADAAPTSTGETGPGELQTVRVGTVPLSLFAPLFIADAKGYFADEGIQLDIQTVTSGQDAVPLTATGQLDVLVAGFSAGVFNAIGAGLDVEVVGSMALTDGKEESAASLVVRSTLEGEVEEIADLKGRNIAIAGGVGGSGAYFVATMLAEADLTLDDVTLVNLGNADMPAALANGGIDAGMAAAPFNLAAIADGTAFQLAVPEEGMSSTGVMYNGDFAETDLAQKFFSALARGSQDIQDGAIYDDENLEIIAEATGQELESLRESPLFIWLPDLAPLPDELASMEEIWMSAGAINYTEPLDPDNYIDSSFAENVDK
ncbi:MAG: ABC transporter substrate-binding protein [Actinomycetota bacterium]|nr:ABC transporter substrate-binding protein [Actinomycetota bacterium]